MWRRILLAPVFSVLWLIALPPARTQAADMCGLDKLTASDAIEHAQFGHAVSISGDVAVIGAWGDHGDGTSSGAAYVYRFDGTKWIEEAKLTTSDGPPSYFFGCSVAISGNVVVIGANSPYRGRPSFGYANVYRFDGTNWIKEAELTPSDLVAYDGFGVSVSISGEVALVGAYTDDDTSDGSCTAGLAEYAEFQNCFTGDDGKVSSGCEGYDLDQDEDIDLGDYHHFLHLECDHGSAYVYRFDGGNWIEEAKLTASNPAAGARFGGAVSISGNAAVIGANLNDDAGRASGSAYVYRFDGSAWIEETKLTWWEGDDTFLFGNAVAISGNVILVSARRGGALPTSPGAGYIYRFDGETWSEDAKLIPFPPDRYNLFGETASISGDVAVIGAQFDDEQGWGSGAAYVYRFNGNEWVEQQKLAAFDAEGADQFGSSVSVSDSIVLVGALGDGDGAGYSGSAYVFSLCDP